MKSLPFIGIYWILLFLSKDYGVLSLTCEMDSPSTPRLRGFYFCQTARETFPEWCHCNKSEIDLSKSGTVPNIQRTSLAYYFDDSLEATAYRCAGTRIGEVCICPAGLNDTEKRNCRQCQTQGVSEILCLAVDEYNHVIANDQDTTDSGCNITELCRNDCLKICKPKRMETLPPPVRPNMTFTTVKVTTETTSVPEEQQMESIFLFAGIGAAVLIIILFGALVLCCRKSKDMKKKKESPYEAVYSTIDDGSLQNGNALRVNIYPNRVYDTRVEGPPVLPTRHEIPPHHKSLPALNAGIYIPSGFSESAYQPTYPHQQMSWTNNPTLFRYPSTDDVSGYKSYSQNHKEPSAGAYMYLKKPRVQPTQIPPSGTVDMAPEDMKEFLNLSAGGRPGYQEEQTAQSVKLDDDAYTRLNRDPRSLPAEGNRREHENFRQRATYGFERRNHSSRGTGFKPVPAKRGAYRSKGDVAQTSNSVQAETGNYSSSDSDYEENRSSSPYYFKMKVPSGEDKSETEPMMNNSDYQKLADTEISKQAKKKSSKRNPKPRSRRVRRRPTAECTGEVIPYDEDDVQSQGEYTDDDIEEGLNEMQQTLTNDLTTEKAEIDFEDSDYHSPELLSG